LGNRIFYRELEPVKKIMGAEPEPEPVKTPKNGSRELRSRAFLGEPDSVKKL
jgi:hypothetical protein